jgi:non-ribosomal peptide synthetase component F
VKHVNGTVAIFLEWWHPEISSSLGMSIASLYSHLLRNIILNPHVIVKNLDLFTEYDKKKVTEWNGAPLEIVDRCVHDIIQEQARLRLDTEAVCSWDGSLSYFELDALASKLSFYLRELGIGPECIVALCFEKSVRHITTLNDTKANVFLLRNGML